MAAILKVEHASKQFGGLMANEDISFEVEEGGVVGVVGPNGAGKTTLFNSLSRAHSITSGKIFFKGVDISKSKPFQVCRQGIGRTYQIPQSLDGMTVLENITVGALCHRNRVSDAMGRAKDVSAFCDLADFNDAPSESLNVMQKKRLEIARALAGDPELLLLDETMAGLNGIERRKAIELIKKINARGVTILMIEHVMQVVMTVSEKVVVIVSGRKLTEGTPREVTAHEEVIRAYLGGGHNADR
ncbi:MAG: ABC transporter ATP-binding protein [Synergistaceae bacterium]|jgi:branched-chain amino acid transport system ATP-binding protein|nr:ABC transporter ATP-binding protein [Synergistaceae bacterium]